MELTNILSKHVLRTCGAGALAAALIGCASNANTTPQLVNARRAYDEAADSAARTRAPNDLSEARMALDRAEEAHDQEPGSDREAHLARRAERKARYAEMRGDQRSANRTELAAKYEPRGEAAVERERVRDERQASKVSDRRSNAALQSLAQVANVKQESRGVVITMSGSLLFPSGERDVSPIANQSLDQVAHALAQQPSDTTFQIEGYTDSSGSENENLSLSEKRAQLVADRLVESGIDSSRISVVGRGEAQPIADNQTTEGRAANRRVEIVVVRHDRS